MSKLLRLSLRQRLYCSSLMAASSSVYQPPVDVRGMTKLKPEKFKKTVEFPYIRVPPRAIGRLIGVKALSPLLMQTTAKLKRTIDDEDDPSMKRFLFDPDTIADTPDAEARIREAVGSVTDIKDVKLEYTPIELTYDDWDVKRCIRAILPEELEFSGHTQIGHIMHLNLREELMPYRFTLGQILLDKIHYARTVVNKCDPINSQYRFFELELLAGEPDYIATVSENGFKFKVDFSKVFWNSRLSTEHKRIVAKIVKDTQRCVLFDVFAGVGPFVIPITRSKNVLKIYANDLNPVAVEYMRENIRINKIKETQIEVHNEDGAKFIRDVFPVAFEHFQSANDETSPLHYHFVMNLPALAVTFVPSFLSSLHNVDPYYSKLTERPFVCILHCHMFVKATEDQPTDWYRQRAIEMVNIQLAPFEADIKEVHFVRNVAGRKHMYCVTFELSRECLMSAKANEYKNSDETASKKTKLDVEDS